MAGWLNALEAFQKTNQVLESQLTALLQQSGTKQGCVFPEQPIKIKDPQDMRRQGPPKLYQHSGIRGKIVGLFSSFRNCNCFIVARRS